MEHIFKQKDIHSPLKCEVCGFMYSSSNYLFKKDIEKELPTCEAFKWYDSLSEDKRNKLEKEEFPNRNFNTIQGIYGYEINQMFIKTK